LLDSWCLPSSFMCVSLSMVVDHSVNHVQLGISLAAAGLVAEGKKIAMTNRVSKYVVHPVYMLVRLMLSRIGAISCAITDILVAAALAATFYKMEASLTRGRTLRT
jgi:hypothetical protein